MTEALLEITALEMTFAHPTKPGKRIHAVDNVTFSVSPGEVVGLVGESGSGKSTVGRCVLGLESPTGGSVRFEGEDITHAKRRQRERIATDLQVVFQDPYSSLNPFLTVGESICEPLRNASKLTRDDAMEAARDMLVLVGLPREAVDRYPREFSGGQRQRIAIARALVLEPKLVVCDEAVSALDLSTQAQVLNLLASLAKQRNLAYVFIAHDLDVVHYIADRTVVLYRGRVMEQGDAAAVHDAPLHPYTAALLTAAPVTDPIEQAERRTVRRELLSRSVSSAPAGPATGATGCPYAARCAFASDVCQTTRPRDTPVDARTVACHMYDGASGHPLVDAVPEFSSQHVIEGVRSHDAA